MAEAVQRTIAHSGCLVAEAGTGTGKTLAYLIPAILSGQKTLIATATRTLQDQLFQKDLPIVRRAVGTGFEAVLLKGRANYLCLYRLESALSPGGRLPADTSAAHGIKDWASQTRSGDIAEFAGIAESSELWPLVTSNADNCLGQECPNHADCFLVKARRAAQEADLVVINHHLLWADWTLRSDGFGEILPDARAVVVDEAHQFPDSAQQFLGINLTSRQLAELAQDILAERFKDARDVPELLDLAGRLQRLTAELHMVLGPEVRRRAWVEVADEAEVSAALSALRLHLTELADPLKLLAIRGKGLESCARRCGELDQRLAVFADDPAGDTVAWFETRKRGFTLSRTPLAVANEFSRFRQSSRAAWIFTSATLTVRGQFHHFLNEMGLSGAACMAWESPFDFERQSLLYLPAGLPDPGSRHYNQAVIAAALLVLKASQGRAFILFTSYQALHHAAECLSSRLSFPLFVQGSQPKQTLLERFKNAGNGVLLGTGSFWEGVDVPGAALSCVIIDKLPFESPGDPVLSAKLENLRHAGGNPFADHQLPRAIIALKQGIGRLIRDRKDRGVLMLCDPRLTTRSYGKLFLDSLPRMPITRQLAEVEQFFARDGETGT